MGFLPVCKQDMKARGWDCVDFVYVIGDAYVDHPSFGPAIISRVLSSRGYRIGIISQPDWNDETSIQEFGMPRLGFLVCAGNMDTMVNHYTSAKKRRHQDAYTPGGVIGRRPDRATVVYCNFIRKVYKKVPIIIGGIEASLRRLAHYDYWSDSLKRSILLDSGANLLSYGMGEHSIVEIAEALDAGIPVEQITYVRGTVYRAKEVEMDDQTIMLPSYKELCQEKKAYAESFYTQYMNTDPYSGKRLVEPYKEKEYVVQNPPAYPLTTQEMDDIYDLPYMRTYHPMYEKDGGIPALADLRFSLVSNRGCFGGCSFCALTFHQGRILQTRSKESILREAELMIQDPDFKGYIFDVGGPTANFRQKACEKQETKGVCPAKQCLYPKPCPNLRVSHEEYLDILHALRSLPGVKKVFIRSGIRFDYVMADKSDRFLKELCENHVSGQLKVAPEHVSGEVLKYMGKPDNHVYEAFIERYTKVNRLIGKKQYVVPYLMSSHPGSTMKEAVKLAEYVKKMGFNPEQVQDFYPTPSTISTCMFYTGLDPRTMKPVYVPKSPHEKAIQRALIQYRNPDNYDLVLEGLKRAGRMDLVGFDQTTCLISPRKIKKSRQPVKREEAKKKKKTIRNVHKK
ncbi:MAG: YgiQ family radical SAM protein [Clostridiales bacterium]|nr:YgiQ family radical SAM protein [Clostridiales bacterium]